MKQQKKYFKPLARKIDFPEGAWTYKISKGARVIHFVNPKGTEKFTYFVYESSRNPRSYPKNFFTDTVVTYDYDDYYDEGTETFVIKPAQVRKFIEEVLNRK